MDPIQAELSFPPSPPLGLINLPHGLQHFTSAITVQTSPLLLPTCDSQKRFSEETRSSSSQPMAISFQLQEHQPWEGAFKNSRQMFTK
jgi:hypothetical protein